MTRAVIDTNVVLASQRSSSSPHSPNGEIMLRWEAEGFEWLLSQDIVEEYIEKLLEHGNGPANTMGFDFPAFSGWRPGGNQLFPPAPLPGGC